MPQFGQHSGVRTGDFVLVTPSHSKGEKNMSLFVIDKDKCKRDGICAEECPAKIIELKDKESVPVPIEKDHADQ